VASAKALHNKLKFRLASAPKPKPPRVQSSESVALWSAPEVQAMLVDGSLSKFRLLHYMVSIPVSLAPTDEWWTNHKLPTHHTYDRFV
jgi:hypothetical protein